MCKRKGLHVTQHDNFSVLVHENMNLRCQQLQILHKLHCETLQAHTKNAKLWQQKVRKISQVYSLNVNQGSLVKNTRCKNTQNQQDTKLQQKIRF